MNNLHITLTEFRNESRVLKEAKTLLEHGVVDVVHVAALHSDDLAIDQSYSERLIAHRFKLTTKKFSKNLTIQLLKYFEYCFRVYFYYKNKDIKLVNVHSLGLLPLGVLLKFLFNAKLIYDAHELETEKNGDGGLRRKISKWVEKILIKQSDLTIVVSESIADWYAKEYNIVRPEVILNAPNYRKLIKTNHFRQNLGIRDDQIILLYQGGLAVARGVQLILDAFKARDDDGVIVVFMGYGNLENEIKFISSQNDNIFYYPAVAPQIVLEYTASADLGIHLIQNNCLNHYYCMPNKLFEYAMAGLPVLVSNMKDMSELVTNNQIGAVISDFSAAGINRAIDEFLERDLASMKANAYGIACENAWEVQEKKMLAAYEVFSISNAGIEKVIQ